MWYIGNYITINKNKNKIPSKLSEEPLCLHLKKILRFLCRTALINVSFISFDFWRKKLSTKNKRSFISSLHCILRYILLMCSACVEVILVLKVETSVPNLRNCWKVSRSYQLRFQVSDIKTCFIKDIYLLFGRCQTGLWSPPARQ